MNGRFFDVIAASAMCQASRDFIFLGHIAFAIYGTCG